MSAGLADSWLGKGTSAREAEALGLPQTETKKAVRRLFWSLVRPHRRIVLLGMLCAIVRNIAATAVPYLIAVGLDDGVPAFVDRDDVSLLVSIVIAVIVLGLVQAATEYGSVLLTGQAGQRVIYDLRCRLFEHVQRLGVVFGERYTSGRVIARLTNDVDALQDLLYGSLGSLLAMVLTVGTVTVMLFSLDPTLAAIVYSLGVLVAAMTVWFKRNVMVAYRRSREAVAFVIMHFVESLRGIAVVQAFRREPVNSAIFEELNETYRVAKQRSTRLNAFYGPGVQAIGNLSVAIVVLVGGMRVLDGEMTIGVLTAFLLYLRRLIGPVLDMSQFYTLFQAAIAAMEKIAAVMAERPVVEDPAEPVILATCRGEIRFDAVRFGYGDRPAVLDGFDLHVPAGQTIALVGPTGAGKSTIVRLLSRFSDPQQGTVSLDGVDLRRITQNELRRHVVLVTQENFLFSASVADNIAFGRPAATRKDIEEVAATLGMHDLIASLPHGYDTHVGKRGAQLSAGERQLVSFARAMLADPQVLILDEATSSLDLPSERRVQRALEALLANRTAVIIAHRLSTIEIADRVLVIDHGRIMEDARPGEISFGAA